MFAPREKLLVENELRQQKIIKLSFPLFQLLDFLLKNIRGNDRSTDGNGYIFPRKMKTEKLPAGFCIGLQRQCSDKLIFHAARNVFPFACCGNLQLPDYCCRKKGCIYNKVKFSKMDLLQIMEQSKLHTCVLP